MPRSRRVYRKKKQVKRKRKWKPRIGMPPTLRKRLKYCELIHIDPGAGLLNNYVFSANSIFDPNVTGTGHQPLYTDEIYSAGYEHATVTASTIKVTYLNPNTTAQIPGVFSIILDSNPALQYLSQPEVIEHGQKTSRWQLTGGIAGNAKKVAKLSFNARKYFGKKFIVGASEYKSSISANPGEQAYYQIAFGSADLINDPSNSPFLVEIIYDVTFSEKAYVIQS